MRNVRKFLLTLASAFMVMGTTAGPAFAEVSWFWSHFQFVDPDRFSVQCSASTDAGQISNLTCSGSWFGATTPQCQQSGPSEQLSCNTGTKTCNCPQGSGSGWALVLGHINGDFPEILLDSSLEECDDEEEV